MKLFSVNGRCCCCSITHSLFHSRLKSFLFCKSSLPEPFLFLIQVSLYGFPRLFTLLLSISVFLLFSFSVLHFLVVVSVRYIKLTYVGFRAHVKIASRIVSYAFRSVKISNIHTCRVKWRTFHKLTIEFHLNNTINLRHFTQHILSCYIHKMAIV